jgi:hypothetical protein
VAAWLQMQLGVWGCVGVAGWVGVLVRLGCRCICLLWAAHVFSLMAAIALTQGLAARSEEVCDLVTGAVVCGCNRGGGVWV